MKKSLNNGLVLKKSYRVIQFNQETRLKPYIDMNKEWRKNSKNDFEKDFFKLTINAVFGRAIEIVRNHRYIKLVTIKLL